MSNLAKRLATAQAVAKNVKEENKALETQALQHVIAMGGGVAGAVATRWLPGMIPGTGGDAVSLLASTLIIDGLAMYAGSPELLAFSFAYEGKIVGDAFEVAMGWRKSPAEK